MPAATGAVSISGTGELTGMGMVELVMCTVVVTFVSMDGSVGVVNVYDAESLLVEDGALRGGGQTERLPFSAAK